MTAGVSGWPHHSLPQESLAPSFEFLDDDCVDLHNRAMNMMAERDVQGIGV